MMQLNLDGKIYAFSVNVFSFVKTLSDKNLSDSNAKILLNSANHLYSLFLEVLDGVEEGKMNPDLSACIKEAGICLAALQKIELTGALLNEKVDLTIDANQIIQQLNEFKF